MCQRRGEGEQEVLLYEAEASRKEKSRDFTEPLYFPRRLGIYDITSVDVNPNHWMNLATSVAFDRPI